jgi:hypothetical protein
MLFASWKTEFQYGGGSMAPTPLSAGIHCCQVMLGLLGQFSKKNKAAGEKLGWKSQCKNLI